MGAWTNDKKLTQNVVSTVIVWGGQTKFELLLNSNERYSHIPTYISRSLTPQSKKEMNNIVPLMWPSLCFHLTAGLLLSRWLQHRYIVLNTIPHSTKHLSIYPCYVFPHLNPPSIFLLVVIAVTVITILISGNG